MQSQQDDEATGASDNSYLSVTPQDKKNQKHKSRSKLLYFWSCEDVGKWLRKHCTQYHKLYASNFMAHDINGRSLVRLCDSKLERMDITDPVHREDLLRHILQLKLTTENKELKTLHHKGMSFDR